MIALTDCIKGNVYKLRSRNLSFGVFDGKSGFIGIRSNFESRYLATEYHYDTGAPFGTAKPTENLGDLLDTTSKYRVLIQESWPTTCGCCGYNVEFENSVWVHKASDIDNLPQCSTPYGIYNQNTKLYYALLDIENTIIKI